jgi:DNA-binding IclR family transcriptional regulator
VPRKNTIRSDERILDIVESLKSETTASVTALAAKLEMPKSTVHAHLSTLRDRGYVVQNANRQYRLSLRFLDIGMDIWEA